MRVWALTAALFMGLMMWGADELELDWTAGGDQQLVVDGGGSDDGIVTATEDGYPPPKP